MRRLAVPVVVAALSVAAVGCGGSAREDAERVDGAGTRLASLGDVAAFGSTFDADRGAARLILLLSPT